MSATGGKVAVVGIGHSKVYRRAEVPLGNLAIDACTKAIEDAGLKASDIDGVATTPLQPFDLGEPDNEGVNRVTPGFIVRALGLDVNWGELVTGMVGQSLILAINAVAAGACKYALVWRAMYNPVGRRYGHSSPSAMGGPAQFTGPYGLFGPATFAFLAQRYMDRYGATREQMAAFIVNNRRKALMWEHGYWYQNGGQELTVDDYMTARMISEPLCIHDCDIPVHACGAFVVTTAERARDLRHPPAYVLGTSSPYRVETSQVRRLEDYMEAGAQQARHLWENSGVGPKDVDVANIYDGFSIICPLWLESLGFCGEGEGFSYIGSPTIPLNTSSGSLGSGRMHGASHIVDAVLQVMGRSGPRQVEDAHISMVVVMPAPGEGLVFSRTPN